MPTPRLTTQGTYGAPAPNDETQRAALPAARPKSLSSDELGLRRLDEPPQFGAHIGGERLVEAAEAELV